MSIHIGAEQGAIAETVLLSGDPLRAKYIAETLFDEPECYSDVRNMLGYTGYYKGQRVSIQGTGMGQASLAIYLHELIHEYNAKKLIRIGTCGALRKDLALKEIILAQGACTDGTFNRIFFNGLDYAPLASFKLLQGAYNKALDSGLICHVGNVFSTDLFYFRNDPERWAIWREHQVLCADMETAMLYTMAAGAGLPALSILTVSDNIVTGSKSSTKDREQRIIEMAEIALALI